MLKPFVFITYLLRGQICPAGDACVRDAARKWRAAHLSHCFMLDAHHRPGVVSISCSNVFFINDLEVLQPDDPEGHGLRQSPLF